MGIVVALIHHAVRQGQFFLKNLNPATIN